MSFHEDYIYNVREMVLAIDCWQQTIRYILLWKGKRLEWGSKAPMGCWAHCMHTRNLGLLSFLYKITADSLLQQ